MTTPTNKNDDILLSKIIKNTEETWREDDREYAEKQLRKIYSQQLSKLMKEKKYYIMNHANKEKIDNRVERFYNQKINKITKMLEQSHERKEKLIKDRVKTYEQNDKRWFHKKQEIKTKVKEQEKGMVQVAKDYRLKSQTFWKERQVEKKNQLRQFSSKYHKLYNSNIKTIRSQNSATVSSFNEGKLSELLRKRKARFQQFRSSKYSKEKTIDVKEREKVIRVQQENQKLHKMMEKINKIEKAEIKHEQMRKKQMQQKQKMRINQKIYKNLKPVIGEDCQKHTKRSQNFRSKTLVNNSSVSPLRNNQLKASMSRSNSFYLQKERREESLMKYYQKTRRIKIIKNLKMNIRNILSSQFQNSLSRKDITIC